MKRTSARQLATADEVREMMAKEAKREPAITETFPRFETILNWLEKLGLDGSFLFLKTKILEEVVEEANRLKPMVSEKTKTQMEDVCDYLGEEDKLEKADLAIIFGGRSLLRADKAAELYLNGYVKKLVMSGKSPHYTQWFDESEAIVYKKRAMELGVPEEDIITETEAINVPSNVRGSLNLLDGKKLDYKSIISVIAWYAQRRAWCTLRKYLNPKVKIIRVNCFIPTDNILNINNWYKTREGVEIVFNEYVKMRVQQIMGTS